MSEWTHRLYRLPDLAAYEALRAMAPAGAWLREVGAAERPAETDPDDPATVRAPAVPLPGWHVLAGWPAGEPAAWAPHAIAWEPGLPLPAGDSLTPAAPAELVPAEISRAQARVVMAAHILPDGRSLLRAMRELLAAQQAATASLPDADPRQIAATQAAEWWAAAAVYHRHHPVLLQAAAALGIAASEIDALFRMAAHVAD